MKSFLPLKKTKKDCSEVKNHEAGPNLLKLNFLQLLPVPGYRTNILFIFYIFSPGSGPRRENECGSMQIRIHSPDLKNVKIRYKTRVLSVGTGGQCLALVRVRRWRPECRGPRSRPQTSTQS